MRKQIITRSLHNIPFISLILKYDYYIESKMQNRLKEQSSPSFINNIRIVSKDQVLVGTSMGELKLVNLVTGKRHSFNREDTFIYFELLNSDQVITTHDTKIVKIWSLENLTVPQHVFKINKSMTDIAMLPNSKFILYRSAQDISIFNSTGTVRILEGHSREITCFASMNNKLISGSYCGELKMWNLETQELEANLEGHISKINSIVIMGDLVCSSSMDDTIRIWNNAQCIKVIHTKTKKIIALSNNKIISSDLNKSISVWNIDGEKELQIQIEHNNIKLLPNNQLISISFDGFKIWDLDTGKCVTTWTYKKQLKKFDVTILPEGSHGKILLTINNDLAIY